MRLNKALEEKMMDVRLRDKLVGEGKLSKEQVEKYLNSIEDEQKNAAWTDSMEDDQE